MYVRSFLVVALASLAGCALVSTDSATPPGTDSTGAPTGSGPGDEAMLRITFSTPGFRAPTGLVLTRLDVWVAEIVFDADTAKSDISVSDPVEAEVDVLTGVATPDVVGITLQPDCYGSPYLGVELWDDGPEPALTLEGTLDSVPVRFVFDSAETFETEAESLLIAAGAPEAVEFTLDPARWFANVDAAALQVGSDGVAEISETSNAGVFDRVADALDVTTDGRFPANAGCKKGTKTKSKPKTKTKTETGDTGTKDTGT